MPLPAAPPRSEARRPRIKRTDRVRSLVEAGERLSADGDHAGALEAFLRALDVDPNDLEALVLAGAMLVAGDEHSRASELLLRSLRLVPTIPGYNLLGACHLAQRQFDRAVCCHRTALTMDPTQAQTWQNLLFSLDLHPQATWELRAEERARFDAVCGSALFRAAPTLTNDPDPDRGLVVGYLSGNVQQHSASLGWEPIVAGHDPERVSVRLYDVGTPDGKRDAVGQRVQETLGAAYLHAAALSDDELAARIRADGVDILVDTDGVSAGGRPLIAARHPAPVVVTGLGYGSGLGLSGCDYLVGDEIAIPPEHERRYRERILTLPALFGCAPPPQWPALELAPFERPDAEGAVTFGYLGRAVKLSPQTLAAWAEVLRTTPNSRLLVVGNDFTDPVVTDGVRAAVAALGVHPRRVEVQGGGGRTDHIRRYAQVDVALDPFPMNGGMTTVEATMMGVPSITLCGQSVSERVGASLLLPLGHPELVASSPSEYVRRACQLAAVPWTTPRRAALRLAMSRSVLFDIPRLVAGVEDAYRGAWREWCETSCALTSFAVTSYELRVTSQSRSVLAARDSQLATGSAATRNWERSDPQLERSSP